MLRAASRLARAGSAAVSAAAGLLMLVLLAFGGFALWQDAAVSRRAFAGAGCCITSPPCWRRTTHPWPSCRPATPMSAAG